MTDRRPLVNASGTVSELPTGDASAFELAAMTQQGSAPSAPSAGKTQLFAKTDGKVYKQNATGGAIEIPDVAAMRAYMLALG